MRFSFFRRALSDGITHFRLNGPVGSTYVIQVSSSLIDWLPFSTNAIPATGSVLITNLNTLSLPQRFYRATPFTPVTALINGSFELPELPSSSTLTVPAGSALLPGWSVSGGFIVISDSTGASPAKDGKQYLSINPGNAVQGVSIAQEIATSIGAMYEVTFYLAATGSGGGSSMRASAKSQFGGILAEVLALPPPHDMGYGTVQQFVFTATSPITTIEFLDTSSNTSGVDLLLDAVTVQRLTP